MNTYSASSAHIPAHSHAGHGAGVPLALFPMVLAALKEVDPTRKCEASQSLWATWQKGELTLDQPLPIETIADAGRPEKPLLVAPETVPWRSVGSIEGRAALLHAIAHIEFNAINLALDAAYRFQHMPREYYGDWLRVAAEEALHFGLINQRLAVLGYAYGDFPAHAGLWDLALATADDALARMALVPRLMEARGLDATPPIVNKFRGIGDKETLVALEIIQRDEIGHVALGNHWFRYLCEQRGLPVESTYLGLIEKYGAPLPRPPMNESARIQAGFSREELLALQNACAEKLRQRPPR